MSFFLSGIRNPQSEIALMSLFLSAIRNPQSAIGTSGSSTWQIVILSLAICLLLFEILRGWRLGIMRQLMRVAAVVAGYATAYFGGNLLVPLLRSSLKMPDIVISALGGAILAVAVYGIISALGRILFKRTAQQGSSVHPFGLWTGWRAGRCLSWSVLHLAPVDRGSFRWLDRRSASASAGEI